MSRSRHTEAQMIAAVKQMEAGRKAEDVACEAGVSGHTIHAWKSKYGSMDVSEAQDARRLRDENARLRKLVADVIAACDAMDADIVRVPIPAGWLRFEQRRAAQPRRIRRAHGISEVLPETSLLFETGWSAGGRMAGNLKRR